MNIRIFGGISVAAIVAAIALNISISTKESSLSDVFLDNVEALAQNEYALNQKKLALSGSYFCCTAGGQYDHCTYSDC